MYRTEKHSYIQAFASNSLNRFVSLLQMRLLPHSVEISYVWSVVFPVLLYRYRHRPCLSIDHYLQQTGLAKYHHPRVKRHELFLSSYLFFDHLCDLLCFFPK